MLEAGGWDRDPWIHIPLAWGRMMARRMHDWMYSSDPEPGLNGRQVADGGRSTRPELKVLFMTGYAENAAGKAFLGRGMEIITKPFATEVLARRIRAMVEGAR